MIVIDNKLSIIFIILFKIILFSLIKLPGKPGWLSLPDSKLNYQKKIIAEKFSKREYMEAYIIKISNIYEVNDSNNSSFL